MGVYYFQKVSQVLFIVPGMPLERKTWKIGERELSFTVFFNIIYFNMYKCTLDFK